VLGQDETLRAADLEPGCDLECRGGFDVIEGLVDPRGAELLRREALALLPGATAVDVAVSDAADWRGGAPARRFLSASGGPAQDSLYQADWLQRCLEDVVGTALAPSGPRGTYTFYIRPGDFLALHRDIDICDVAAITCLQDGPYTPPGAGSLYLYPTRAHEPLSSIRADPRPGRLEVKLEPAQTIVLLGGLVPHYLSPVAPNQARIISVLCFRIDPLGGVTGP
jgi:hypothetical protein